MNIFYHVGVGDKHPGKNACEKKVKEKAISLIEKKEFRIEKHGAHDHKKIGDIILELCVDIVLKKCTEKQQSDDLWREVGSKKNKKDREIENG